MPVLSQGGESSGRDTEGVAQTLQRIERIGKHLFGVAVCIVRLRDAQQTAPGLSQASAAHAFCESQPASDGLQILPDKSSPFQPALGKVDQFDVRFYLSHLLRGAAGESIGTLALIHDRPRAFTAGDRLLLDDLLALIERELHR